MIKKRSHYTYVTLLLVCCCLFLFGCSRSDSSDPPDDQETPATSEELLFASLDTPYESFQKIVGWLSEDTLLVHIGESEDHELIAYNIFTGETSQIYSEDTSILSVELNLTKDKILIQEVTDVLSRLKVITVDGLTIQTLEFDYASYVTFDWNPTHNNTVFISHYSFDHVLESETIQVYIWTIDENTLIPKDIPSLSPRWYSANVYLYIDEINTNALYIGDIREDDSDLIINRDIADFYLNQDTFLGLVESDISENQVHLFHEYPFLVGDNVISVPKVTMNGYPIRPHLTQSKRNGKIYGVIPEYSFTLEEDLGEYQLAHLDFENETVEEVMEVPEDAPIALSPTEEYLLYGWRLENIVDISKQNIIPILEDMN